MAVSNVRLPRLLPTVGAQEYERLNPEFVSAQLNLQPPSTARMQLPEGSPTVRVRNLVELFDLHGSLGLFRVTSVSTEYGSGQAVEMRHSIATLADDLTDAERTLRGSIRSIVNTILGMQTIKLWALGDVEISGSGYELQVDRHTLLEAVKLVDDYGIFPEQNGDVWKIHIRKLPTTPSCECRLTRNADSVTIDMDDHELCTRVYSEELPGGYLDSPLTEWGRVARTLDIPAGATDAQALRYANAYLRQYEHPAIAIKISAIALADLTGEQWDSFQLGGMCRVALPEWEVVQEKRIITIDYTDLVHSPSVTHLQLSAPERRIEEILVKTSKGAGGAGKTSNKNGQEIQTLDMLLLQLDTRLKALENLDVLTPSRLAVHTGVVSGSWGQFGNLRLNGSDVRTQKVKGTDGLNYTALVIGSGTTG